VNWEHLQAFLWLRWRLRVNQNRRAGAANVWVQRVLLAIGLVAASLMLLGSFLTGLLLLPRVSAPVLMLVWDGVIVLFLFVWMTELLVELQRSELLAMDKFLHLPVSLTGAFLINYIGSIFSPGVIVVLAAMVGLSGGLLLSRGISMIGLFPLVTGFILAVTAIGYQFRGWLASLMVNKRRRRAIVTIAGVVFVLIVQLPNLVTQRWRPRQLPEDRIEMQKEIEKLDRDLAANKIEKGEYRKQSQAVRNKYRNRRRSNLEMEDVVRVAGRVNLAVPIGWLPYGAKTSAEGRVLPSILGALGLTLIAAASLRRSYMTTLRLYRGEFGSSRPSPRHKGPVGIVEAVASSPAPAFLEKRLPWLTEEASVVTLASFRSLTRAPEARILFLSPVFMVLIFGSMILRGNADPHELLRPLIATGGIGMILLVLSQLAGNQFGFDRNGFRTYVLSPAERRNILIGKNLALAPIALGLTFIFVLLVQLVYPMRIDHFVATLVQPVPMYFIFCVVENFLSMLAPMPVAPGSLKPVKPKGIQVLIHIGFLFLFPLALSPTLIPLGLEFLLDWTGWSTWFPVYLAVILAECAAVAALYPAALDWQGGILQQRERQILEVVTSKSE
jgi:ABC-2 type transport system permease protein